MGFKRMTTAIPVQCSTNIELSSRLGAGHFMNSYYTHRGDEMKVNIIMKIPVQVFKDVSVSTKLFVMFLFEHCI